MTTGEHLKSMMDTARRARVIAVASGKGGVGKTNISANLAVCLAAAGNKVVLVDADFSLGNVDIVMGIESRYNISHIIDGTRSLAEVVSVGPCGVELICGASGLDALADMNDFHRQRLIKELDRLSEEADVLIIDSAAGIGKTVTGFCMAADHVLVVSTPEPTSMTDCYAMIKVLAMHGFMGRISLVVNMAESLSEGKKVAMRIARVAKQFLNIHVYDAAVLVRDDQLCQAVRKQIPVTLAYPKAQVTVSLAAMANRLASGRIAAREDGGFFRRMANWFA